MPYYDEKVQQSGFRLAAAFNVWYIMENNVHTKGGVMAEVRYEIVRELGVISENEKGWRKEVNLVSWNERAPKYDIRDWSPGREKMSKGMTLTKEEARRLKEILNAIDL